MVALNAERQDTMQEIAEMVAKKVLKGLLPDKDLRERRKRKQNTVVITAAVVVTARGKNVRAN